MVNKPYFPRSNPMIDAIFYITYCAPRFIICLELGQERNNKSPARRPEHAQIITQPLWYVNKIFPPRPATTVTMPAPKPGAVGRSEQSPAPCASSLAAHSYRSPV